MSTHASKTPEDQLKAESSVRGGRTDTTHQFMGRVPAGVRDPREEERAARSSGGSLPIWENSPRMRQLKADRSAFENSAYMRQLKADRVSIENSPRMRQLKAERSAVENSKQAQQWKAQQAAVYNNPRLQDHLRPSSQAEPLQKKSASGTSSPAVAGGTGGRLLASVQSGVEQLSGMDLSDVKVHYNSSEPAQMQAHAFAQGNDIHVAPGQEKHLGHEAWHVVQQRQGRVKPTKQLKGGVGVNDDAGLEREADVMGAKAMQMKGGEALDHEGQEGTMQSATAFMQRDALKNPSTVKGWKTSADKSKASSLKGKLAARKNSLNLQADNFKAKAATIETKINELLAKADGLDEKKANKLKKRIDRKKDRAKSILAKADEARKGATEMSKAQTELAELATSETEFTFKRVGGNISYTYMDTGGTVIIEYSSDANAIHELTHAYQHLNGEIELIARSGGGFYVDATDEVKAYKRQYFFDAYSVIAINSDADGIATSQDIDPDWVTGIWFEDEFGNKEYPYKGLSHSSSNKP